MFLTQDPIGLAGGVNLYAYAGNNPVAYSDPYGLSPDAGVGETVVLGGAVLLGLATTAYAYTHGQDWEHASNAGYNAGRDLVIGIFAAVSDKIHDIHLRGQENNINAHFAELAGGGGSGKDPDKWGDKWKKDIEKGIRLMRDRLERLNSKADRTKWAERIDQLQQRLDDTK